LVKTVRPISAVVPFDTRAEHSPVARRDRDSAASALIIISGGKMISSTTSAARCLAYGLGGRDASSSSDDETIAAMRTKLAADGFRFDNLIEAIVNQPKVS